MIVMTWNIHGLNLRKWDYIHELVEDTDILCVAEARARTDPHEIWTVVSFPNETYRESDPACGGGT